MHKTHRTIARRWCARLALGAALSAGAALAQEVAPASSSSPPSDSQLASAGCIIGEEKFLPADYFYCVASQSYGQHRYSYAQKFFRQAAAWGSKPAQYVLGVMALNGDQQPVDRSLALAWLSLAAERQRADYQQAYQQLYANTSAREHQAAETLLRSMRPIYADATAATRAETRYHDGMKLLARLGNNSTYCMEGMFDTAALAGSPPPGEAPVIVTPACPSVQAVAATVDKQAASVFDGWQGHVTVGPLQSSTPAR
jgi:TPR repeat protein